MNMYSSVLRIVTICFLSLIAVSRAGAQNLDRPLGQILTDEGDRKESRMPGRFLTPRSIVADDQPFVSQSEVATLFRPDVGDTMSFNTPLLIFTGWRFREFTLMDTTGSFYLWIETAELSNGNVTQAAVDSFMTYLRDMTPPSSVDATQGIYDNTVQSFGALPDVDGDARLDILWYDIRDDYPSTDFFIESMALLEDVDPNAAAGTGNARDVVYVDTDPLFVGESFGLSDVGRATAAALQRLIHLGTDPDEESFVVAGLSDYSSVLNGYEGAGNVYLRFPGEHNIALFSWGGFLGDVQRASLFSLYLSEQLGLDAVADLVADTANGSAGVSNTVNIYGIGRQLEDVVIDFHTANALNRKDIDPRYGYDSGQQSAIGISPSFSLDASRTAELSAVMTTVAPGGVQYFMIENVFEPSVRVEAVNAADNDRVRGNLIGYRPSGNIDVQPLSGGSPTSMSGAFDEVIVVFSNVTTDTTSIAMVTSASWSGTAFPTTNVIYGDGTLATTGNNHVQLGPGFRQATFLPNPEGYRPVELQFSPFYRNQFVDTQTGDPFGSPDDPRDFILCIAEATSTGVPADDCLVELDLADPRPFERLVTSDPSIDYLSLDLLQFGDELDGSGDLFAVLSESGTDDNILVLSMSEYTQENVSYLFGNIGGVIDWYELWEISVGGVPLTDRYISMNAQFQDRPISTAVEPIPEGSSAGRIYQPYPNPFSEQATIDVDLDYPADLSIQIFDILGRSVATIADSVFPSGQHEFQFRPGHLSSGLYLYRVGVNGRFESGSMIYTK
ncbi:MAG: T9SS type A sorting domain-containing protein [Rhodothermales bacterium]|nr:T9SS type A sorting domain-containing protein [Rhodothermales bacterium]